MKTEALREASQWVVRQSGATLDQADHDRFRVWYQADPSHAAAYDRLHHVWRHMGDVDRGKLANRRKSSVTLCALIAVGALTAWLTPPLSTWTADYRAGNTVRSVTLPDGSTAVLDAGAAIALDFEKGQRDIKLLAGRAYIASRPRLADMAPLRVITNDGNATALGTRFSVETSKTLGTTVSVYEHRVLLNCLACQPEQSLTLSPGESARAGRGNLTRLSTTPEAAPMWMDGLARFNNARLSDVAAELGRYTSKAVVVRGDGHQQRISGTVATADTHQALRFLLAQTPWRVSSLPGLILIQKN